MTELACQAGPGGRNDKFELYKLLRLLMKILHLVGTVVASHAGHSVCHKDRWHAQASTHSTGKAAASVAHEDSSADNRSPLEKIRSRRGICEGLVLRQMQEKTTSRRSPTSGSRPRWSSSGRGKFHTARALKPQSALLCGRRRMDTRHRQLRHSNPAMEEFRL